MILDKVFELLGSGMVFYITIVFCFAVIVCGIVYTVWKKENINKQIDELANNVSEITPEEFMKMRKYSFGGRGRPSYALTKNFAGVYILFNESKNMYYVGQGKQVLNRVYAHFTGKGNGDVYADYKYGDSFKIRMIALENSGFDTLNELERYTISRFDAYSHGYNKTRGNRN